MSPVRLRPLAEGDLIERACYHRSVADEDVATRFFDTAMAALRAIGRMPGIGSPSVGERCGIPGLRVRRIPCFPCGWLYFARHDHVDVVRLLANTQDPDAVLGDIETFVPTGIELPRARRIRPCLVEELFRRRAAIEPLAEGPGIRWTSKSPAGSWPTVAMSDTQGRLAIYALVAHGLEPSRYDDVAVALTHLNSGMIIGNWELTVETGDIVLKTSIDVGDEPLTPGIASRLLDRNIQSTERDLDAVRKLASGADDVDEILPLHN